jgi:phage terminase large subunit GpA-like protein
VRFLIAAVDVQGGRDKRFVVQVIGYGVGLESWLVDRYSLRYLDEEKRIRLDMSARVEHWEVLVDQVMAKAYPLADGSGRLMPIRLTACDSGGEEGVTDRAYAFPGLAGLLVLR